MNPFSNRYLVGATVIVIVLQFIAIYTPVMNTFLKTVPLNASDWIILVPIAALIVPAEELRKLFHRRKFKKNGFAY